MKIGKLEISINDNICTNRHASKRRAKKMADAGLLLLKDILQFEEQYMPGSSYDDMNMARIYMTATVMRLEKIANAS